jgi:hypothetical protein
MFVCSARELVHTHVFNASDCLRKPQRRKIASCARVPRSAVLRSRESSRAQIELARSRSRLLCAFFSSRRGVGLDIATLARSRAGAHAHCSDCCARRPRILCELCDLSGDQPTKTSRYPAWRERLNVKRSRAAVELRNVLGSALYSYFGLRPTRRCEVCRAKSMWRG